MTTTRLLLVIAACTLARASAQQAPPAPAAAVAVAVDPDLKLEGASPEQADLIQRAKAELDRVLDSDDFRKAIEKATFEGRRLRLANGDIQEPDNAEILKIILEGRERQTQADNKMTLDVRLRELRRGTVGSTRLGSVGKITTSYWFVNRCVEGNDPYSMAGHLAHEWMHKAGFTHYPDNSARGDVPYEVGKIVRKLARDEQIARNKALGLSAEYDRLPGYLLDEAEDEVID